MAKKPAKRKKLRILEGSAAIAEIIKTVSPAVVSAYPITPQTHIVEKLAKFKVDGGADYEYVRAESEFAAASIILGAAAAGQRVYSATSSQGLLLMTEVLFNIAGLRLPAVITCANRAISAPINIWNDHADVMAIRDAGWLQFFATDQQEAVDQHLLAYKVAEKLSLPAMVNVDGYILTHALGPVMLPEKKLVKQYLPDYRPAAGTYLDPDRPLTRGAFFGPASYMETRARLHDDLVSAQKIIEKEYRLLRQTLKTPSPVAGFDDGLVAYYGPKNPETILIGLGSMVGTMRETARRRPHIGVLAIKVYRPFPGETIGKIIRRADNVAVLEKAISLGEGGPLYGDLKAALGKNSLNLKNYIVGLGGRDVTEEIIAAIIDDAGRQNEILKFYGQI